MVGTYDGEKGATDGMEYLARGILWVQHDIGERENGVVGVGGGVVLWGGGRRLDFARDGVGRGSGLAETRAGSEDRVAAYPCSIRVLGRGGIVGCEGAQRRRGYVWKHGCAELAGH